MLNMRQDYLVNDVELGLVSRACWRKNHSGLALTAKTCPLKETPLTTPSSED